MSTLDLDLVKLLGWVRQYVFLQQFKCKLTCYFLYTHSESLSDNRLPALFVQRSQGGVGAPPPVHQ